MISKSIILKPHTLVSRAKKLNLGKPCLMGILNSTPDSFSDSSRFFKLDDALEQARKMINDGADWLDIGGESSGPDSQNVPLDEELQRVIPLIQKVRMESDIWISVDTWKAEVARQSLEAGADTVNDVTAMRGDTEMAKVIAEYQVPVILMFSKDNSARTSRQDSDYVDVLDTLKRFSVNVCSLLNQTKLLNHKLCWIQGWVISSVEIQNTVLRSYAEFLNFMNLIYHCFLDLQENHSLQKFQADAV